MMASTICSQIFEGLSLPLCRKYLLVVLVDVRVTELDDGRIPVCGVRWGIGVSLDGQLDFLGVWHEPDSCSPSLHCLCDDLKDRGVERICFVVGPDLLGISESLTASFLCVTVLAQPTYADLGGQRILGLFHAVPPRHRRPLCVAVDEAMRLNRSLERAVTQNGSFPTREAATAFVADWLACAESKRDRAEVALAVAAHRCLVRRRSSLSWVPGVGLAVGSAP